MLLTPFKIEATSVRLVRGWEDTGAIQVHVSRLTRGEELAFWSSAKVVTALAALILAFS
jgi:hypothetical protein